MELLKGKGMSQRSDWSTDDVFLIVFLGLENNVKELNTMLRLNSFILMCFLPFISR